MTPEQKQHAENHNIKQLVAPKPPFVILNEMVGGGVQYEYTENPPIPDFVGYLPQLHTLMTEIDVSRGVFYMNFYKVTNLRGI